MESHICIFDSLTRFQGFRLLGIPHHFDAAGCHHTRRLFIYLLRNLTNAHNAASGNQDYFCAPVAVNAFTAPKNANKQIGKHIRFLAEKPIAST